MAGTASTAPAIRPFSDELEDFFLKHDVMSPRRAASIIFISTDLPSFTCAVRNATSMMLPLSANLHGPDAPEILDLLAFGDQLQAVERVVDHRAAVVVRDLADVVADRRAGRFLALGHREDRQIGVVVGLAMKVSSWSFFTSALSFA